MSIQEFRKKTSTNGRKSASKQPTAAWKPDYAPQLPGDRPMWKSTITPWKPSYAPKKPTTTTWKPDYAPQLPGDRPMWKSTITPWKPDYAPKKPTTTTWKPDYAPQLPSNRPQQAASGVGSSGNSSFPLRPLPSWAEVTFDPKLPEWTPPKLPNFTKSFNYTPKRQLEQSPYGKSWNRAQKLGLGKSLRMAGDSALKSVLNSFEDADDYLFRKGVDKDKIDLPAFYKTVAKEHLSVGFPDSRIWEDTQEEKKVLTGQKPRQPGKQYATMEQVVDARDRFDNQRGEYKTTEFLVDTPDPFVRTMQQRLNERGATDRFGNPLKLDGLLGPKTAQAAEKLKLLLQGRGGDVYNPVGVPPRRTNLLPSQRGGLQDLPKELYPAPSKRPLPQGRGGDIYNPVGVPPRRTNLLPSQRGGLQDLPKELLPAPGKRLRWQGSGGDSYNPVGNTSYKLNGLPAGRGGNIKLSPDMARPGDAWLDFQNEMVKETQDYLDDYEYTVGLGGSVSGNVGPVNGGRSRGIVVDTHGNVMFIKSHTGGANSLGGVDSILPEEGIEALEAYMKKNEAANTKMNNAQLGAYISANEGLVDDALGKSVQITGSVPINIKGMDFQGSAGVTITPQGEGQRPKLGGQIGFGKTLRPAAPGIDVSGVETVQWGDHRWNLFDAWKNHYLKERNRWR